MYKLKGKYFLFISRLFSTILILFLLFENEFSQNPICPPGVYIADPSVHILDDGKLYVYGSTDESPNYYCSWKHDIMVTSDLSKWEIVEDVFATKGKNDEVLYNDNLLYAPDCVAVGDSFYLYYCQPDWDNTEGVAVSQSPTGPFKNGVKLNLGGFNQIDPSVFIDDDGSAYYLWGQFSLQMAKLKHNMKEIDIESIQENVLTEKEHFFHEGAFLTKRNGLYYMIYADISREDKPTCIGYAISESPFGPYKYGGVIIDNNGCNPGNWNNHGSIVEFKNQWYVFYHRSTHGAKTMRKACVEKIEFLKDGSIPEVEMTSQGAGNPLDAKNVIDAATACGLHGSVRIEANSDTNEILTNIHHEDEIIYKYLDFGQGVKSITIRIKSKNGGKLVVSTDKPWFNKIAFIDIESNTENNEWRTLTFDVKKIKGVHALWLQGYGKGELFEIDWFKFN